MKTLDHILNRQNRPLLSDGVASSDQERLVKSTNKWRDQYNPLRQLTLSQAICYLEQYKRGEFADLQWLYYHIEETDEDLIALVENRTGAICEMDWDIKIIPEQKRTKTFSQTQADDQAGLLREIYNRIDNLYAAIEHLAMASFRGFAHLEKHEDSGGLAHLEPLDQWNAIRDGLRGPWYYNPEARSTGYQSLPKENELDPRFWIIRDKQRHINRVALIKFIRMNLGIKDWTFFVELFGIPQPYITLPSEIPAGKETEYRDAAQAIANGQPGALPNGSTVQFPTEVRGQNPFMDYLEYLTKRLILAGTGGMLTMLNDATGMGSGQSDSHRDTFKILASKEARQINELFQKSIDKPQIQKRYGDAAPVLAYFELCFNEETDTGEVVDEIQKLSSAGYQVAPEQVAEKTSYDVTIKQAAPAFGDPNPDDDLENPGREPKNPPDKDPNKDPQGDDDEEGEPKPPVKNRIKLDPSQPAALADATQREFLEALAKDLEPLRTRLNAILTIEDQELMRAKLSDFIADLSKIKKDINADPEQARVFEKLLGTALTNGIAQS